MRAKLHTIDLVQGLRPLAIDRYYDFLQLLVCDHGRPLAQLWYRGYEHSWSVPVARLERDIAEHVAWEQWAAAHRDPEPPATPSFTVAVCTRDRPNSLGRCLAALADLDYPDARILVVDNGSTDPNVARVIAEAGVRSVVESLVGLDNARNCALAVADTELIAFCDDDVTVSPRWLHGFSRAFADPTTAVATGLVLPAEIETYWQHRFEQYGGMSKGLREFTVDRSRLNDIDVLTSSRWGVGANMAFRRDAALSVGGFDPQLDVGTPSGGAGDIEMLWRMVHAGHRLTYRPDAWVRHAHRRDKQSLLRQIEANGRSYGCYLRAVADRDPSIRTAVRAHARQWVRGWLLRQVAVAIRRTDWPGLLIALAELRGAIGSGAAYRATRQHQAHTV
jgi:glycosyltransferase involved in cell wall biosynthesis